MTTSPHADQVALYAGALRMVRDAIEDLFGPVASLESEEAVLLRGPMPHHAAEAIIAALQRVRDAGSDREVGAWLMEAPGAQSIVTTDAANAEYGRVQGWSITPLYVCMEGNPTHRHLKRGTEYVLIGYGKMQAENWFIADPAFAEPIRDSVDMREVAIYRSVDDGSLWARPREEFDDRARFAVLEPSHG